MASAFRSTVERDDQGVASGEAEETSRVPEVAPSLGSNRVLAESRFARELPGRHPHPGELHLATVVGSILVLLGGAFLALATIDFLTVRRQIQEQVIAPSADIPILLAGILIAMAAGVAVYIWVTAYA